MSEKLNEYFKNFALHGNLWNLDDHEALYVLCMEAILEKYNLEEKEFISLFEEYCISEYIDWTKKERAKKWYLIFISTYNILKYLSKNYSFSKK